MQERNLKELRRPQHTPVPRIMKTTEKWLKNRKITFVFVGKALVHIHAIFY